MILGSNPRRWGGPARRTYPQALEKIPPLIKIFRRLCKGLTSMVIEGRNGGSHYVDAGHSDLFVVYAMVE
jgi:hypothetical protein